MYSIVISPGSKYALRTSTAISYIARQ